MQFCDLILSIMTFLKFNSNLQKLKLHPPTNISYLYPCPLVVAEAFKLSESSTMQFVQMNSKAKNTV